MRAPKTRTVTARGMIEYRPQVARGLPVGSRMTGADNTAAQALKLTNFRAYHARLRPVQAKEEVLQRSTTPPTPNARRPALRRSHQEPQSPTPTRENRRQRPRHERRLRRPRRKSTARRLFQWQNLRRGNGPREIRRRLLPAAYPRYKGPHN